MKHLFIINPNAGKRGSTAALDAAIRRALPNREVEVVLTQAAGHGEALARAAAQTGAPVRIYACGGDGTLNEVVNGAAGFANAAVTNVPKGTGNDFLRIFGPRWRAAFTDLTALADGPQAPFDLMDCNGRLGIGVICAGVDARVADDVVRHKHFGSASYVLALAINVLFKPLTRPVVLDVCGCRLEEPNTILCICNGRYYGGGFMPVGEAMPDDGVLDVLTVSKVSRLTFLRLVGQYAKGLYRNHPEIIRSFHGRRIVYSSPTELVTVVDGEVLRGHSFTVSLSERKVNFFWPSYVSYQPSQN